MSDENETIEVDLAVRYVTEEAAILKITVPANATKEESEDAARRHKFALGFGVEEKLLDGDPWKNCEFEVCEDVDQDEVFPTKIALVKAADGLLEMPGQKREGPADWLSI